MLFRVKGVLLASMSAQMELRKHIKSLPLLLQNIKLLKNIYNPKTSSHFKLTFILTQLSTNESAIGISFIL